MYFVPTGPSLSKSFLSTSSIFSAAISSGFLKSIIFLVLSGTSRSKNSSSVIFVAVKSGVAFVGGTPTPDWTPLGAETFSSSNSFAAFLYSTSYTSSNFFSISFLWLSIFTSGKSRVPVKPGGCVVSTEPITGISFPSL